MNTQQTTSPRVPRMSQRDYIARVRASHAACTVASNCCPAKKS